MADKITSEKDPAAAWFRRWNFPPFDLGTQCRRRHAEKRCRRIEVEGVIMINHPSPPSGRLLG